MCAFNLIFMSCLAALCTRSHDYMRAIQWMLSSRLTSSSSLIDFPFFLSLHSSIPAEISSRAKLVNWQHSAAAAARDQVHERGNEWNMVELARFRELKGEQWLTNCAKETWKSYQYKKLISVSLLSYIRIVACRHLAKSFDIRNDMCLLTNCFFANKTREPKQSELMWRPAKQHRHVSNSRNLNFASVCTYCNGLRKK